MDNLMSTRTVIIIMDLMDMRLSMITRRDLLRLVMVLLMFMLSRRTMDMATQSLMNMDTKFIRGLLRLDMVMVVIATSMSTGPTLITRLRFIIHRHITMDMARGLLNLVMVLLMSMLSRRTMDMATLNLMNMDTTSIRDLLNLDMDPMKVTKKYP